MFDPIDLIAPVLSHFSLFLIVSMLSILKHLSHFCNRVHLVAPHVPSVLSLSTCPPIVSFANCVYSCVQPLARVLLISASSSSSLIVGDSCSCCMVIGLLDGKRI
eukprot:240354_1